LTIEIAAAALSALLSLPAQARAGRGLRNALGFSGQSAAAIPLLPRRRRHIWLVNGRDCGEDEDMPSRASSLLRGMRGLDRATAAAETATRGPLARLGRDSRPATSARFGEVIRTCAAVVRSVRPTTAAAAGEDPTAAPLAEGEQGLFEKYRLAINKRDPN
jgi:hypothetical protein